MWLILAILAGGFYTIQGLLSRKILKSNQDAWAFSFYFSFFGALTTLPFMLAAPKLAYSPSLWFLMLVVGVLIVIHNYLNFKSLEFLEASIQGSITKFRLLWILLIGIVFLGESFSWLKILGTLLTISAGLLIYFKLKNHLSALGLGLALSATFIFAIVIASYKFLFSEFNSVTLTFFVFAIPALINLMIIPKAKTRLVSFLRVQPKIIIIATIFGGLANIATNQALAIGEASKVLVIVEAFLVILLVGEHLFLGEKNHFAKKLLAVVLATAGAILIRLAK